MKRLLSLILATALVIGLIPVVCATDSETGNGNEWTFSVGQHNVSEETLATGNFNEEYGISNFNGTVSDAWGFVNIGGGSEYDPEADHILYEYNLPEIKSIPEPDSSYAIALELDPDTSGTFNPTITVITETTAPIYEVYLMEKPANSSISVDEGAVVGSKSGFPSFARSLDKSKRLGLIDAYGTGALKTVSFPAVTVEADTNYWLILSPNGANENREGRKATSGGVAYYRATLKLVSFTLTDEVTTNSAYLNYDITTNALSDGALKNYGNQLTTGAVATTNIIDNGELQYVSWVEKISGCGVALDSTKTDGYELAARQYDLNTTLGFRTQGVYQEFKLVKSVESTPVYTYNSENISGRMHYMVKINVPVAGKYSVSILNKFTALDMSSSYVGKGAATKVYIIDAEKAGSITYASSAYYNKTGLSDTMFGSHLTEDNCVGIYNSNILATDASTPAVTSLDKEIYLTVGEYYVLFDLDSESYQQSTAYWNRTSGSAQWYAQYFTLSGIQLTPVTESNITEIQSSYDSIVNVDAGNAVEKTPANTTSNVQILCGVDKSVLETKDVATGSDITYTAPEKDGYTFLYWAQGVGTYKKIVSYDAKLSVKAEKGPMWLTAVYSDNSAAKTEVVFYNANGDEISRSQYEENDVITLASLPSMAGFETATGWTLDADGKTYTAADEVKASGKLMRFVAQYDDEPSESFDVTVVGGTADNETPAYGETVTVTATPRSGAKLFNYWQKDGEIVSFDLSYSFKAWKDTTITAVYNDYLPIADTVRKIIIGTRTVGIETAAVAEFIGISDVVEKGILFGTSLDDATHKISMKTDGDTFSVIDDVAGDGIGYAILSNGNVIYSK